MINAIDVLRVLESFKALKATDEIPNDTKKRIAGELLTLVPSELMVPSAKITAETIRDLLKAYITDGNRPREARITGGTPEAEARKAPEGTSAPKETQETGVGPKEVPEVSQSVRPSHQQEVAGTGDRDRVQEPPKGTLGRPGVAGKEARSDEKRKGQGKATRRP